MATELVPSTILFPAKKWFLWNENLNTFHRYLLKALLCILFKVSFHVAVWPVRLCCIILYVPLHVFEYLRICPLIAACKLSRQHFPKFKNEILFTFLCLSVGRREGGYREFLKCGGGGGVVFRSFSQKFAIWPPSLYNYGQKSTKKRCGICSTKLIIKTSERHQCFSLFSCFRCFFRWFCQVWTNFTLSPRIYIAGLNR